jgi:hypothetical protein
MNLTYTLLADGSSDKALIPIINWTLEQIPNIRFNSQFAELSLKSKARAGLFRRAEEAIKVYECDILLMHRDAEKLPANFRIEEIRNDLAKLGKPYIPIVPIRMTEAWLLIDEQAIRSAASNPNGTIELSIPRANRLEDIPDPKNVLFETLKLASELPAGRLRKFRPEACRHRVAELISDYSQLRKISAFVQFESDLMACVQALNGVAAHH